MHHGWLAELAGFLGPVDFIQAVLTPELWERREEYERWLTERAPAQSRQVDDKALRAVEDEGGLVIASLLLVLVNSLGTNWLPRQRGIFRVA